MATLYRQVEVSTGEGKFAQNVSVGPYRLVADELSADGGSDKGPVPHEFLLVGLGACTSMTVKLYAERKNIPLESVDVRVRGSRDDTEGLVVEVELTLHGALDDAQRERLLQIAGKCPVHRT
ncbi:MAG TPA: OsmC family protein, partial [Polyangiaceae bacterium]|nr:OsmC family protein [Polyangiaceae bacterium]